MVGIGITNFEGCHIEQIQHIYLKRAFASLYSKLEIPDMIVHASMSFMEMYNRAI